ncbi:unnamed protein product [Dracunculus medinensis]|uniref:Uncharacterized protein n=1 Tax=Dracunculus medinensis TaxID=318479 RepID=A0A0N4UP34_DRAME|nr:unnamed protein product [Dracunculus medinensis]
MRLRLIGKIIAFFQVLLRSLSRPFSNVITNLATNHPKLRSLIFIPAGRALIRLTIRLRMQNLGFGKPATVADVTETAAAEIANFILFVSLSLAVFYMSKWVTPETAKKSDFEKAIAVIIFLKNSFIQYVVVYEEYQIK